VASVSVIIRCMNEEAHLGRLLSGIAKQSTTDVEVIVVDSGSTDGTLAVARRHPVQVVNIAREEFSFGYSLNTGCAAARGTYLVFASAHVYPVYEDWLERLTSHFQDARVGVVYGKQRGDQRTKFSEHQIFGKWFPDATVTNQPHPFCNNANLAIRKSLWEQIRYDETLTGLEDLDWAKKVLSAGHRIVYEAEAEVVHVHDERPRQIYNRYRREAIAMKAIFPHESFGFWEFLSRWIGNVVSDWGAAARQGALWRNVGGIVVFRLAQFFGTWRGYAQRGAVTRELMNRFYYPRERQLPGTSGARTRDASTVKYSEPPPPAGHD
jgi:rhamnosyltransferase